MTADQPVHYLSIADVVALHEAVMERTGYAATPLRSEALLDSAIQRPKMAAYYENVDIIAQAALLGVGIAQAQAFLDGNKRTAFAAMDVFLRLNGRIFAGDSVALARQLEAIATRTDSLEAATGRFEEWLRAHTPEPGA